MEDTGRDARRASTLASNSRCCFDRLSLNNSHRSVTANDSPSSARHHRSAPSVTRTTIASGITADERLGSSCPGYATSKLAPSELARDPKEVPVKRIVETVVVVAVAIVASIALSVGEASAWHPVVNGEATCSSGGGWTVQWTVGNGETAVGHVMTFDSVDVNGVTISLSPTNVAPGGTATGTSIHDVATSSAIITVNARWTFTTPNMVASVSATVNKPDECVESVAITATTATTATPTTTTTITTATTVPEVMTVAPVVAGAVATREDTTQPAGEVAAVELTAEEASSAQLPATGRDSIPLTVGGAGALLVGVCLVAAARRRSVPL